MAVLTFDAVSLDLETQGTDPGDVILSIGMIEFNSLTGDRGSVFYVTFDPEEWLKLGYTYRESTLKWWAHPDRDKARATLAYDRCTVQDGLKRALEWLRARNMGGGLWSRGYMDETMLKLAIRRELGIEDPWHYRAAHDARTMMMLIERLNPMADIPTVEFQGIPHNALWDALHEAKLVHACLTYLKRRMFYNGTEAWSVLDKNFDPIASTVGPTRRSAIVNWLMTDGGVFISNMASDEKIENEWIQRFPKHGVTVSKVSVTPTHRVEL